MTDFFDLDFNEIYPSYDSVFWCDRIISDMHKKVFELGFSNLLFFTGLHRHGKSYGALSFALRLDPTFRDNMESRIIYDSESLVDACKDLRSHRIRGGCILLDEATSTSELSSQSWFEASSKVVSRLIQSIGYLRPQLIFVGQNYAFLNSVSRRLIQMLLIVKRNNNLFSSITPYNISYSPWNPNKVYKMFPTFVIKSDPGCSGVTYKVNHIRLPMPSIEDVRRYETVSQSFKDRLLQESLDELRSIRHRKENKNAKVDLDGIVKEVLQDLDSFTVENKMKQGVKIVSPSLIRHKFDLSLIKSRDVKTLVEKQLAKK